MIAVFRGRIVASSRVGGSGGLQRTWWSRLLLAGLLFSISAEAKLMLVAHRGIPVSAPENTLSSFERAKRVADFVEFDVWPTKDGELVVIHDQTVDRTTNGKGAVSGFTLAELRQLDCGSWFDKAFVDEKIPTAAEALAAIQTDAAAFMERKGGTVEQFVLLLERQPLRPEGIVMSFDYGFVAALKKAKRSVQVGWIGSGEVTDAQIAQAVSDGISHFIWANSDVTSAFVDRVHRAGAMVFGWTVNDIGTVNALNSRGIDGIITDRSGEFCLTGAFASPFGGEPLLPPTQMMVRGGASAVLAAPAPRRTGHAVEWRRKNEAAVLGKGARFICKANSSPTPGRYVATWTENGAAVSREFEVGAAERDNQLINISARMSIGGDEATGIVGFVVKSTGAPRFLLRAVGPSLARFGITDPVGHPALTLFRRGAVIDSDSSGSRTNADSPDFVRNGAFALVPGSDDVAIMKALEAGAYTVHLSSKTNQPGVGLIEVYQDNTEANWALGAPVNVSLRGRAIPGSPLIGGFVVPAGSSQTVLVRGIGPSLSRFGVKDPLVDPLIRVYDWRRVVVAENDDWWAEGDGKFIESLSAEVGAFWIGMGRESAVLVTLGPGAYSAVLSDASGDRSGVGLLEIYAVNSELEAASLHRAVTIY